METLKPDTNKNGIIEPDAGRTTNGRRQIVLGQNFDRTYTTLPPYVDVGGGVQVHPSRVEHYLARREVWEKKQGPSVAPSRSNLGRILGGGR